MNTIERNDGAFVRPILDDAKETTVNLYTGQRVTYKPRGKRYSIPCYVWAINPAEGKAIVKRLDTGKSLTVRFEDLKAVKP